MKHVAHIALIIAISGVLVKCFHLDVIDSIIITSGFMIYIEYKNSKQKQE